MESHQLTWYGISRQAAPGVLLGQEAPVSAPRSSPDPSADLSVAFGLGASELTSGIPSQIVIPDILADEVLSWLHTYSPETFPLSQYCRVVTATEWDTSGSTMVPPAPNRDRVSAWASVIVGEMLGQGEYERDLLGVPLSRATACSSYTIARTAISRANGAKLDLCQARLTKIESDGRFARRQIPVWALVSVWATFAGDDLASGNLSSAVAEIVGLLSPDLCSLLTNNPSLQSNSAEERIKGFDQASNRIVALSFAGGRVERVKAAAALAGAALFAGRGTSHIALLSPFLKEMPECLAWYGLFSGIAGPRYWDADWLRLVKGVERQLRLSPRLEEPAQVDLCWVEYDWLNRQNLTEAFWGFPKISPRVLSVEIVIGSSCQFRVGSNTVAPAEHAPMATIKQPILQSSQKEALAKVQRLVREMGTVLQELSKSNPEVNEQKALFDVQSRLPKKVPRTKVTKPTKY